mmetsp:Transcript_61900/g.110021  ORF Transcript_61900/g.110021 Transcript_61900/m.110021 type:complete len:250 (-) Transcript_61900:315-1064(-)
MLTCSSHEQPHEKNTHNLLSPRAQNFTDGLAVTDEVHLGLLLLFPLFLRSLTLHGLLQSHDFLLILTPAFPPGSVQSKTQRRAQENQKQPRWRCSVDKHSESDAKRERRNQHDDAVVVYHRQLWEVWMPPRYEDREVHQRADQDHELSKGHDSGGLEVRQGDEQRHEDAAAARTCSCSQGCGHQDEQSAEKPIRVHHRILPGLGLHFLTLGLLPSFDALMHGGAFLVLLAVAADPLAANKLPTNFCLLR